ncbi:hypothetical protein SIN8267_02001 [Sinobacterium norvegicum]|uniref:Uncharacterized protein n=1 Tax=Sinobacterium norvegicum TaxID=1641715 RepID=A0ABN8ENY0_9GAMM|nr:YacL family protein [Sinobacterium norvegicum]CAH0991886.1 hypothetical protein SIN8267_02001 [Sinobacterium norvegicum]
MDYRFSKDFFGHYQVEISPEQEAFSHWLTNEIGRNQNRCKQVIDSVQKLQQKQCWDFDLNGQTLHLALTREQAIIHPGFDDVDDDLNDEGLCEHDYRQNADCGLEDFALLIRAWYEFISG